MSEETRNLVKKALSSNTCYGTEAVLGYNNKLIREKLDYRTLNEDLLIEQRNLQEEKKNKMISFCLMGGMTLLGALVGQSKHMGQHKHGEKLVQTDLNLSDITQGAISGFEGSKFLNEGLRFHSEADLNRLKLLWMTTDLSYRYHVTSHRGQAEKRLLMIELSPSKYYLKTRFAVLFPDGYVAYLCQVNGSPLEKNLQEQGLSYDKYNYVVSGEGEYLEWIKNITNLDEYTDTNGMPYLIELWDSGRGRTVAVIKYKKPHHSVY